MNNGERIRALRTKNHMSQDEFGAKIGLKRSGLSLIESGRNNPTEQTILSICREFGVNEKWLRTGEGEPFKPVPLNEEIRQYFVPLEDLSDEFKTAFADALAELQPEDWEQILDIVKDMKRKAEERRAAREKEDVTILQAAHQRTDVEIPEGVDTSDDEFFD